MRMRNAEHFHLDLDLTVGISTLVYVRSYLRQLWFLNAHIILMDDFRLIDQ
jgi:hypothetical protein